MISIAFRRFPGSRHYKESWDAILNDESSLPFGVLFPAVLSQDCGNSILERLSPLPFGVLPPAVRIWT